MEIIDFKAGPQIVGTIVRDMYGNLWTVLKNIGYASAQPREGAYYTRYIAPVEPAVDYKALYEELKRVNIAFDERLKKLEAEGLANLDIRDFKQVTELGLTTIRIIK